MSESIVNALMGGALIGVAVTLMLLLNGRVTGISGIVNLAFSLPQDKSPWRWTFIAGLIIGGGILYFMNPDFFTNTSGRSLTEISIAGLLVGFGTIMGSGCTSGHGVCGISRFSIRSLLATVTFIAGGVLTATLLKGFL